MYNLRVLMKTYHLLIVLTCLMFFISYPANSKIIKEKQLALIENCKSNNDEVSVEQNNSKNSDQSDDDKKDKKNSKKQEEQIRENALMIDAATAFINEDFVQAEKLYSQVLKKNKTNATALYYLSNIYFEKNEYAKAIEYCKQAIDADKTNIWYKMDLVQMHMAMQDYDEAANTMKEIVNMQPEVLEYHQQLAQIYHVKGDTKHEIACLDDMEKRFGISEPVSMQKYTLYKALGRTQDAKKEILSLSNAFPHQSKYLSILAEMAMQEKDYNTAINYYHQVEELNPDDELMNFTYANYYLVRKNDDSVFYYLQRAAKQENIDFEDKLNIIFSVYQDNVDKDTIAFYRFFTLLETMATTKDTLQCRLWSMLNLGYMRLENYNMGAVSAKNSLDLGCNAFDLYNNWLFALNAIAVKPDSIIKVADITIESYPEQPIPYLFKGVGQMQLTQTQDAIETLKIGLKRVNRNDNIREDFYSLLGDCYHDLKQDDSTFYYYDLALQMNPNNYVVLNNYAYYLSLQNKDLDKALQYIEIVMQQYPSNLTYVDTYAWVLYCRGQYKEAKKAMDKTLSQKKDWGKTMQEHYAEILKRVK